MNVADNEYPADEFDRLADARTIRGTRRRKESNLRWWLVLVAVAVLAPAVEWAISDYIGSSEEEPAPTTPAKETPSDTPSGASPTAGPSGNPSSSDGNKPSESGEPGKNPSTDASATPLGQESGTSADADANHPILVLNGPKKPGLAATGKQELEKADYTRVSANNYSGGNPAVSTVFYAKASDVQAAKQVAVALDIRPGNVVLVPEATGDDRVVAVFRTDTRWDARQSLNPPLKAHPFCKRSGFTGSYGGPQSLVNRCVIAYKAGCMPLIERGRMHLKTVYATENDVGT